MVRDNTAEPVILQRGGERARVAVDGKRTNALSEAGARVAEAILDGCPVSAPKRSPLHLVVIDDALDKMHRGGAWMASCGALVPAAALPPWECPEGCECELMMGYYRECVRVAAEPNGLCDGTGAAR